MTVSPAPTSQVGPPWASRYRWLLFAVIGTGYLLVYFHRLAPAVVALDMMRDLSAGGGLMGLLASAYFYPYALMQIPSGLLSDSWGPRKTITVFFVIAGLGSVLLGLAPNTGLAVLGRTLVGLGVAMLFVPSLKLLTCWFSVGEFAKMTGLFMAVGGLGALSATAPMAWLSVLLGWRGSFLCIGVATLLMAAVIWIVVRDRPEDKGLPPVDGLLRRGHDPKAPAPSLRRGLGMVMTERRFWPIFAWFFFTFGIFFSFGGLWGGPYLMHAHGLSKAQAGGVLSMLAVGLLLGGPLYSILSDRLLRSRKKPIVASAAIMLLLTLPLAFAPGVMPLAVLYHWCLLFGFAGNAVVVVGFSACKELFPTSIAGTAVGLMNLSPFLAGAIMQPLIGLVLEAHGTAATGYPPAAYGKAFLMYVGCGVLALASSLLISETFGGLALRGQRGPVGETTGPTAKRA